MNRKHKKINIQRPDIYRFMGSALSAVKHYERAMIVPKVLE